MRLLADENVPGPLVRGLVDAGCDVSWIRLVSPGASDGQVLDRAVAEERVLLTFDKDFGELARATVLPARCGIILMRVPMPPSDEIARLCTLILSRNDWAGHFSVVEPGRIRSRPLGDP